MAAAKFIVECPTCHAGIRRDRRVVELEGRCPRCGGVLPAQRLEDTRPRHAGSELPPGYRSESGKKHLLSVMEHEGVAVVSFGATALLDRANVQQLGDELDALVDTHKLLRIVLDFSNVNYMSSTVMSKLIVFQEKLKAAGGHLQLCCIGEQILEAFKVMKAQKLFKIKANEADAIRSMPRN